MRITQVYASARNQQRFAPGRTNSDPLIIVHATLANAAATLDQFIMDVTSLRQGGSLAKTQVALGGHESFCGTPIVLGRESWPCSVTMQADRLSGVRIASFASTVDRRRCRAAPHPAGAVRVRLVQASERLVSNARQRLNQRRARWLLM
jgi:hypothetical protein